MILVTGATGHYGKAAIDFLLKKGISANNIAALVRDESKAEDLKSEGINLQVGDYDNYNSLVEAFENVDKLLLVSSTDISKREKQHQNAINAAKEAGVKHMVYTSFARKNETETSPLALLAKSHIETEKNIKAAGIPYTILDNNLYFDTIPMFAGEKVLETGIFFPAGDGKAAFALRNDMAEAAANILTSEGHENRTYSFSNTENVSFQQIADILGELKGKDIQYISPDVKTYKDTLSKAGVPVEYAELFTGFGEAIQQGEFTSENTDLSKILGRKPLSLKEFLTQTYS